MMQSIPEKIFKKISKEGFYKILKPLGFKRKGNRFCLMNDEYGKVVDLQKSQWNSKDRLSFTINIGFFFSEYWRGFFYEKEKSEVPSFPRIEECFLTKRLGELRNSNDIWYDIDFNSDADLMINQIYENLNLYILPYLNRFVSKKSLLEILEKEDFHLRPYALLIIYGEIGEVEKFQAEYLKLRNGLKTTNSLVQLEKYATRYKRKIQ
ncbi:DUF4304 domain-containing protein [Leptospira noguchii]|uniref:DUF4304 domain-containing protein n=2 Tax=Leptospira noguchii TaxID=28182 RepID=A0AAE9GEI4_9LEPT|nr:DUF4304 domain-containing protein [Leptospira noguchii]UOG56032.1 DUF4304 domain-containing protein [Leptospira noguchii]